MNVSYHKDQFHHRIVSLCDNEKPIGEFRIYGRFGIDTCDLGISIDESYQHKGYSRIMIKRMVEELEHEGVHQNQLFFIDVDASGGFWDHIGMKLNRYGLDYKGKRNMEGRGYEKVISLEALRQFAYQ